MTHDIISLEKEYVAQNYSPLPIILSKGEGVWLWDNNDNKYLDFMSAYSAVSCGHLNKRIKDALYKQLENIDVPSRAYYSDILAIYAKKLCELTNMDRMLPMNTGAEAVETAIKAARKWGYEKKGIKKDKAVIIVFENNFHGRTTTICGFSSENLYKENFGPFDGGFKIIPYGSDIEPYIDENICAVLVEPIQGEAGIITPPDGWIKKIQKSCKDNNILLMLDEIQTGMGRTGKDFCFQYEIDKPDCLILGKALGGGIYPVSAFLAKKEVMDVFTAGTHGSTFGGNPIACAIAIESINILKDEKLSEKSLENGKYLKNELLSIKSNIIKQVRGKGLFIGVEIDKNKISARAICENLMKEGILSKETHETVIRFAPPLIINKEEIDWALEKIKKVLS